MVPYEDDSLLRGTISNPTPGDHNLFTDPNGGAIKGDQIDNYRLLFFDISKHDPGVWHDASGTGRILPGAQEASPEI